MSNLAIGLSKDCKQIVNAEDILNSWPVYRADRQIDIKSDRIDSVHTNVLDLIGAP